MSHRPAAVAALSLLRREKNPNRILSICAAASLSPAAYPDRKALALAVEALAESPESVRQLLLPLLPHHPRHVISLFAQAQMFPDALHSFKSSPPSLENLNALLFASILSHNHLETSRIFHDFFFKYNHITPNLTTYNTLLRAHCESGNSTHFFSVINMIEKNIQSVNERIYRFEITNKSVNWQEIRPNLTTFSIAIAGFYREERFGDVSRVLKVMKKYGCRAGVSIWNVRIRSLCKIRRSEMARQLLREMDRRGVKANWESFGHLILGFCGEGDLEEAKRVFAEMKRRGLEPEGVCYGSLAHYLCKGGDFEFALKVCRESMERNWVPRFSTMRVLVEGLVGVGKIKEAREIVGKVKEKFPGNAEQWKEVEEKLAAHRD